MRIGCMECGAGETFVDPTLTDDDLVDVQANDAGEALSLSFASEAITASAESRTLGGTLVVYGQYGRTSRGRLRVRPGALRFHEDLRRTILTREHVREESRGVLASVHDSPERMRVQLRAADGPEGDAALREARDGSRAGLSFDVIDATLVGDEITDALVIAIGQVGIPAYDDGRIDQIAASLNTEGIPMTPEQRARLAELAAMNSRSPEDEQEFQNLQAAAVAEVTAQQPAEDAGSPDTGTGSEAVAAGSAGSGVQVRASIHPAVPGSVPGREATRTEQRGFAAVVAEVTRALQPGNPTRVADITAALQDITHTAHTGTIEQPAWSGELWSGLLYEPQWTDLFNSGNLDHWEGTGWRFTSKLEIQDYAGDKAEIPSDNVTTESSSYEAARMAVGVDIDRKFFDFPNGAFVESLFQQVRESWAIKLDAKIRAYVLANAVAARTDERLAFHADTNPNLAAFPSLLKAAAAAMRSLKRRRVGQASWVYVNDDDLFTLLDIAEKDVSAFLDLFGIDPKNFRSSEDVPEGTVLAGVKPAATVRTLPGSPIRVDAQNLTKGGIDEAFFGYWAIEEHHTSGIAKTTFTPA